MFVSRRLIGRLFYYLISVLLMAALPEAQTAPAKTRIQDVIYRADGTPASGTLLISWPAFVTADQKAVAAGSLSVSVGPSGAISLDLAPNADGTPAGTFYKVILKLDDGTTATEYWVVPSTSPTTIAAIRATVAPAVTAAQWASKQYVDTELAQLDAGQITSGTFSIDRLPSLDASIIRSGTLDPALIPWGSPGPIGATTPNAGTFTSLAALEGLTVSGGANLTGELTAGSVNGLWYCAALDPISCISDGLAAGKSIHLEAGTYTLTSDLALGGLNNIDIGGEGMGKTVLKMADATNLDRLLVMASASTNLTLHDLTLDANSSNQSSGYGRCLDIAANFTNLKLLRVECKNTRSQGIVIHSGTNDGLEIASSRFTGITSRAIDTEGATNNHHNIHDNYIEAKQAFEGANQHGSQFSHNHAKQTATSNFIAVSKGSSNTVVEGNTVEGLGVGSGTVSDLITVDGSATAVSNIQVSGNHAYNSGDNCYSAARATGVSFNNNTCNNAGTNGLALASCNYCTAVGNHFFNPGQALIANVGYGIHVLPYADMESSNLIITNNELVDNQVSHTMLTGVRMDNTAGGGMTNNYVNFNYTAGYTHANPIEVVSPSSGRQFYVGFHPSIDGLWFNNWKNTDAILRFQAGLSSSRTFKFTWANYNGTEQWSMSRDSDGTFNLLTDVVNNRKLITATAGAASQPDFPLGLTATGDSVINNFLLRSGTALADQGKPVLRWNGTNNTILSANGSGALYFNFEQGTGGVNFGNGASGTVGSVSSAGLATFNGGVKLGADGAHIQTNAANKDTAGLKTLSGGTGTVTFTTVYSSAPVCVCTDTNTSTATAVGCSATTTTLSFKGGTTATIAYHCIGNPN